MAELFKHLRDHNIDIIIASDSNTYFIDWILEANGLKDMVKAVFTNHASFDEQGYLRIKIHNDHKCEDCPVNMCKSTIVQDYLASCDCKYSRMFYAGDGGNDFCPLKLLGEDDVIFAR